MTQQLLPDSPEKTQQHVEGRENNPPFAQSLLSGLHPVAQMQRTLGNQKVAKLVQSKRLTPEGKLVGLQQKLTVGAADDQYEQEADRVAHQVMNTPDALVTVSPQRAPSFEGAQNQTLQTKPLAASITQIVQRQRENEHESEDDKGKEKDVSLQAKFLSDSASSHLQGLIATDEKETEPIQAKSTESISGSFDAGDDVETQLILSKGRGSPLPDSVLSFMEPRFGVDFSEVRVHTGSEAQEMNKAVGAQAFTHGKDIYYGTGRSPNHFELTAHELTHIVQQTGGRSLQSKRESNEDSEITDSSIQMLPAVHDEERIARKESIPMAANTIETAGKPANYTVVATNQSVDAEKSSPPKAQKENKPLPDLDEVPSKKETSETTTVNETLHLPGTYEKAPAPTGPEEDPAYKAVVEKIKSKSRSEKTPSKDPEKKQQETKFAANLAPAEIDKQNAFSNHLDKLEQVQPPELTVAKFMGDFNITVENLAGKLPANQDQHNTVQTAVELGVEKAKTLENFSVQNQTLSGPLRTEVVKNASDFQDKKKQESTTYELKADPPGTLPSINHAKTAAPKPKTNDEISLDDKSRDLDNVLLNHNVQGQTVNIEESSLAYPISGEKTFDEAGETKRKAQDEIAKVKPRYREQEKELIGKSQVELQSIVNSGLQDQHHSRSNSFNEVLTTQNSHKSKIETKKRAVLNEFQGIYEETKLNVQKELDKLANIEETFENIISEAEKYFNHLVENDLEYIYTPGILDYSDWKDKHEDEIATEREKLIKDGEHPLVANSRAIRTVQDKSALELFSTAKKIFVSNVISGVQDKIAKKVVDALNVAKKHITDGKNKVKKAFDALAPEEQKEIENVLVSVMGKFEGLEESVTDRQREIIDDMARNYNQSVGKLQATFDSIKKDVLTSWFEKAWNKLKAIVNAIIEFATRIAELLGRLAYLVGDIVSSPRAFFNNLVNGIGQGFSTFIDRIDEFLATAFFDWLRGSSGLTIQVPKDWDPKGLFSLFTQLLNLGTETIWERMEIVYGKATANAFRQGEVILDKGLEIFGIIKTEGLGGLWDHIKESLGNILEETLETIKETVLYAAVKKVILEIGKLIVPGGGFIAIAEKLIRFLQFIVEARDKILDLIESFVDSVEMAVKGNVPGIVKHITGALTKFITIALDFLVNFFGLGSLKDKVGRFIDRMRKPVIRGIDWVLDKFKPLVMKGKKVLEKGKEKVIGAGKAVVQVGVPEDPNERLRLGLDVAVRAVNALRQPVITAALINPVLKVIKVRYGFKTLQPVVGEGHWWVEGEVNPKNRKETQQEAPAEDQTETSTEAEPSPASPQEAQAAGATELTQATNELERLENKLIRAIEESKSKPTRDELNHLDELLLVAAEAALGRRPSRNELSRWLSEKGLSERVNNLNLGKARLQEVENIGGEAEHTKGKRGSTKGTHQKGQSTKGAQKERARDRRLAEITENLKEEKDND